MENRSYRIGVLQINGEFTDQILLWMYSGQWKKVYIWKHIMMLMDFAVIKEG